MAAFADAMGVDARDINIAKLRQMSVEDDIPLAARIRVGRQMLVQSAQAVHDAMKGDSELAYAEAKNRHLRIQETLSGITAEWGRAGRAFRDLGEEASKAQDLSEFLRDNLGKTLFQIRREMKAGAAMETPAKVSKFVRDSEKPGFWDMFIEYFVNNYISGLPTHVTYSVGNTVLMLAKAIPETALQAGIGALREHVLGDTGPRVYFGEVPAQVKAIVEAGFPVATGLKLAKIVRDAPDAATARADAYALLRGSRDGIMAAARAAIDGTTAPLPGEGTVKGMSSMVSPRKAIPNFKIGSVPIPLGEAVRLPSRGVAVIHSYFRAVGYEQNLARLAYRQATVEGLSGTAFDARVAELRNAPPEAMMRNAVGEATEQTLMGKGGQTTRALSMLTNSRPLGVPLPKMIDPFVHISSNVLEQGMLERSVLGIADPDIRANLLGQNGPIARDTQISRLLFGTSVALAGFGLAAEGLQNGSGPADPKEAALYRRVKGPPNSTRIGDFWYDFHRLGAAAVPFNLGANVYETAHLMSEKDFGGAVAQIAFAVSKTVLDEAGMRGPSEFMRAIEEPEHYGAKYVRDQLSSMLMPYSVGMGATARVIDPYARRVTTLTEAFKNKVPWWSETLFPQRDLWGEPIPRPHALGMDALSAIYEKQARNDPVEQAMLALHFYPAQPEKRIRGVELTERQYDDFARIAGRSSRMLTQRVVAMPGFDQFPEGVRREMIQKSFDAGREIGRGVIMAENPSIIKAAVKAKQDAISGPRPKHVEQVEPAN